MGLCEAVGRLVGLDEATIGSAGLIEASGEFDRAQRVFRGSARARRRRGRR